MNNEELLAAIGQIMDEKLVPIKEDIAAVKEDIAAVKEDIAAMQEDIAAIQEKQEEHSGALNTIIEWADDVQVVVKIPFGKA